MGTVHQAARISRTIIGIVFLLSAVLKAASFLHFAVQVSYYGIVRTPWLVETVALGVIALETALGAALLVWRGRGSGRILLAVFLLLIFFTGLIAWAWAFRGLADCGCFGKFIPMTPARSLFKNAALMLLVALAWRGMRAEAQAAVVEATGPSGPETLPQMPTAQQQWLRASIVAVVTVLMTAGAGLNGFLTQEDTDFPTTRRLLAQAARRTADPRDSTNRSTTPTGSDQGTDRPKPNPANPKTAANDSAPGNPESSRNPNPAAGMPTAAPRTADPGRGKRRASRKDKFAEFAFNWKGKRYDLSRGLHIVAMISDSCDNCAEIVAALNELEKNPDLPPVVGFVLGERGSLEKFRKDYGPRFPTKLLGALEFLDRIGKAPPRFYVTKDGRPVKHWDTKKPPKEITLLETVLENS